MVADALRTHHSNECVNVISQAIAKMQSWVQSGTKQQQTLNKKFDLCEPIQSLVNNRKHISTLYLSIAAKFAETVQYYNRKQKQIANVCNILTNKKKGEPIDRLAAVLSSDDCLYYNYTGIMDAVKNTTAAAEYMCNVPFLLLYLKTLLTVCFKFPYVYYFSQAMDLPNMYRIWFFRNFFSST